MAALSSFPLIASPPRTSPPRRPTSLKSRQESQDLPSSPQLSSSPESRTNSIVDHLATHAGPAKLNVAPVVKARRGAVLNRGLILKTDHYASGVFASVSLKCA